MGRTIDSDDRMFIYCELEVAVAYFRVVYCWPGRTEGKQYDSYLDRFLKPKLDCLPPESKYDMLPLSLPVRYEAVLVEDRVD
jgi:hypothetical protein